MKRAALLVTTLALAGCSRDRADPYAAETARREAFAAATIVDAGAGRAWGVSSTAEITYEEGFGIILYDPRQEDDKRPSFYYHAFRWMGQHAHVRLKTHGQRPMRITMAGWVHEKVLRTRPVIELFIDGYYLTSSPIIETHGHYSIEMNVPEWMLRREWVDLVIRTNAVGFHWGDPPELNTVLVYKFSWTEAG